MRLIIHIGLHKSASTYLQHVLFSARQKMSDRGILYAPPEGWIAHHVYAWSALQEELSFIGDQAHLARSTQCDTVILSSEDFETIIFRPDLVRRLELAASRHGFNSILWRICLRHPGEYFASLYSELAKHASISLLQMFEMVLRKGFLFVENFSAGAPYWTFCFDYSRYIATLESAIYGKVQFTDFHADGLFPGVGIVADLGITDLLKIPSDPSARNQRCGIAETIATMQNRFIQLLDGIVPNQLSNYLLNQIEHDLEFIQELSDLIEDKYEGGRLQILKQ